MRLNLHEPATGRNYVVPIEPVTTIDVIKLKLSSLYQLNYNLIRLIHGGRLLDKHLTAQQLGLQDGSALTLELSAPKPAPPGPAQSPLAEAQRLLGFYLSQPAELDRLLHDDPALFEAVGTESAENVARVLAQRQQAVAPPIVDARDSLLPGELSSDYQHGLEQRIAAERLHQLEQDTYEHYPELFVPTEMLFVHGRVGAAETEVFVDTGAQTTIMRREFAERANVMKNVDRRYAITVSGVGSQKALGRIWQLPLEMNGRLFLLSCTVLEDFAHDVLLGLDMMKRHRCVIDLHGFSLSFGTEAFTIPFISDHQLSQLRRKDGQQKVNALKQALMINDSTATSLLENAGFEYKKAMELGLELRRQRRI